MTRYLCVLVYTLTLSTFVCGQTTTTTSKASTLPPATDKVSPAPKTPPAMKPEPQLREAEREQFLKTADIIKRKVLSEGTTSSIRATLSDGKLTHDAHIQFIDVFKPVFRGAEGTVEKNFRDTYKFNIAAYRMAKLLGIENMVPMSVERVVDGKPASITWWLDNVWMTEAQRRDNEIPPPTSQEWVNQLNVVRVFDQLIYNTDRNQGNLVISPEWRVYMIDHTRAFRTSPTLLKKEALGRCDYNLLQRMKLLTTAKISKETAPYLQPAEIAGLLARRDIIVRYFSGEITKKGEDAVLTGMPRKTPSVTLP